MELRLFIVTVACFSCVVPPAWSSVLFAARAAKGAALIGAGLAKKAAIAGANLVRSKINHLSHFKNPHGVNCFYPIPYAPPQFPSILQERLTALWNTAVISAANKVTVASQAVAAIAQAKKNALLKKSPAPVFYKLARYPEYHSVPVVIARFDEEIRK